MKEFILFLHEQQRKRRTSQKYEILLFAESEGFEPPDQLPGHRISSAARSTTPATFLLSRGEPQYMSLTPCW